MFFHCSHSKIFFIVGFLLSGLAQPAFPHLSNPTNQISSGGSAPPAMKTGSVLSPQSSVLFSGQEPAPAFAFQSPLTRELKAGETHRYPFRLKVNDVLRLMVEQKGIDVTVRLLGPEGKPVLEQNNPNSGNQGDEAILTLVEQDGTYTLEITATSSTAPAGSYELKVEPIKAATPQDQTELEIQKLNFKAGELLQAGKFDQGLPLLEQTVEKSEKTFGAEHPLLADSLANLADGLVSKGELAKAEPLYRRALSIREQALGPNHPNVGATLISLGWLLYLKSDYKQAEPLYQRALAMLEKAAGPDHLDVASCLNNLGALYYAKGDYLQVEPLYRRAVAINEKALGPEHPFLAVNLNNLAVLYKETGNYAQAETLFQRALNIQEKNVGAESPNLATNLNNLGELYRLKGDFQKAESFYQRALAIQEKVLGAEHPSLAMSLNNLAGVYYNQGEMDKTEPLYRRSLAIREKAFGPNHPAVAQSLNNLAKIQQDKGDLKQAERLAQRALAIWEKALGPRHPEVATTLGVLAGIQLYQKDYEDAESLFKRALAIWETVVGPDHPNVARHYNNLAALYRAKGDVPQAIACQTRANEVSERDLVRNLVTGSERQKLLYLRQTEKYTDRTLALNVQDAPQSQTARQAALTVLLRRKGRALDALASSIETLRQQQDAEINTLLEQYAGLAGRISVLTLRGPGRQKPEDHLAQLKTLEEQKENLENEISRRSKEFQVKSKPITLEAVRQEIPADAVLLEYAVYQPTDSQTGKAGPPHFVVYVLNRQGEIAGADLGEAATIDRLVNRLRDRLRNRKSSRTREIKPASQALERLVFQPVRRLLGKAGHLLISPDGSLCLVPFAALMDPKGKYLNEQYRLTYLTSGRDLLRLAVKVETRTPPLVMADPDYAEGRGPVLVGHQYAPLTRLKGTEGEGTAIKGLFPQAELKMQSAATIEAIKAVQRPELLHLATHGYFLEDVSRTASQSDERLLVREDARVDVETLKVENPLLRSWLFFAGANQANTANEQGTLTALEVAQLNLWGTKLVTLSACETGLGETKTGEGVYGLRRALVLAGSEAQLMSLWAVSDRATQELMTGYYRRLKAGEGRSDALRKAQLEMLKDPKRSHPYYWAAFIESGEWANLAGKRQAED
ncbi:MAG: tetratricopeptide repeat protein [Blastocatellia bacterium]|nr:tetratricopeptide repeat protein [Blastocatellia bacterium]